MPETNDFDIREQAAANTLAANPLVGVRGEDLVDAMRVLFGQVATHADVAAQQYMAFLGELGRIGRRLGTRTSRRRQTLRRSCLETESRLPHAGAVLSRLGRGAQSLRRRRQDGKTRCRAR